jgi:hypothetical protein
MWGISGLTEELSAFRERLCSVELFIIFVVVVVCSSILRMHLIRSHSLAYPMPRYASVNFYDTKKDCGFNLHV